jgi:hypothetical protein
VGVRDDIVTAARGEVGQVSDQGGSDGNKLGWDHLKTYFEVALGIPDAFAKGTAWQTGIQKAGQFITGTRKDGTAYTIDWCGIFAVWALRQANIDAKWVFGTGPEGRIKDAGANNNSERAARTDFTQMQPGDILVRHHSVHHCIVSAFDGTNLSTINGNADYQGIVETTGEAWSSVDSWYFYSIDDYPAPGSSA